MIKLRAADSYDVDAVSLENGFACVGPSMTDQSFAEEVDINTIVRRFGLTGQMPDDVRMPTYADFEETYDFHSAMLLLKRSESEFMRLPPEIRSRFNNDPGQLITFLEDDRNRDEAVKLGIVVAPAVVDPPPVKGGDA